MFYGWNINFLTRDNTTCNVFCIFNHCREIWNTNLGENWLVLHHILICGENNIEFSNTDLRSSWSAHVRRALTERHCRQLAHCNVQYDSQVCFGNLCPTVMIHFSSQGLDAWSKWSWIFLCSKWSINFSCSFPLLSLQTSNPWWLKTTPTKVLLCIVTQGSVSRKFRWSFTTRKLLYVHNVYFKDWNFACFEIYAIKC